MKKLFFDFKFKWSKLVHKNIVLDRNEENNQNQNRPSLLTINSIWQFTVTHMKAKNNQRKSTSVYMMKNWEIFKII